MYTFTFRPLFSLFFVPFLILIVNNQSCKPPERKKDVAIELVDKNATEEAVQLYNKVKTISATGFAVGHQETTSYGVGWNFEEDPAVIKSDVKEISGDFPAVFGFEIGHLELGHERSLDSVSFAVMRDLIIDAHRRGGIITISWHPDNPASGGSTWDKTPAVKDIITGGKYHETFKTWVERLAVYFDSLQYEGKHIPVIFRPYHEMNGSWFWWGDGNCTIEDYKQLWQETVNELRDEHNVHHLLYTYSPNTLDTEDVYLRYYPGDDYVDILGIDIYDFTNSDNFSKSVRQGLAVLQKIAQEKNMPYAFTETGLEKIPTPHWYTEILYPAIKDSGIAWVLFWRNAHTEHHYMPFKGHPVEKDFVKFKELPETLFLKDIN